MNEITRTDSVLSQKGVPYVARNEMIPLTTNKRVFDTITGQVWRVEHIGSNGLIRYADPCGVVHWGQLGGGIHQYLREPSDIELLAARLRGSL